LKHLSTSPSLSLAFLFESAYFLLVILLRNETLTNQLSSVLPTQDNLMAWVDCLTELAFVRETINAYTQVKGDDKTERIERIISKIAALLAREAQEASQVQELAGTIEAIRENQEIIRATIAKEKVQGDGDLIRDEITI
jgi:hypothetical protein